MVLRVHGMDEAGVQFSIGPPRKINFLKENLSRGSRVISFADFTRHLEMS